MRLHQTLMILSIAATVLPAPLTHGLHTTSTSQSAQDRRSDPIRRRMTGTHPGVETPELLPPLSLSLPVDTSDPTDDPSTANLPLHPPIVLPRKWNPETHKLNVEKWKERQDFHASRIEKFKYTWGHYPITRLAGQPVLPGTPGSGGGHHIKTTAGCDRWGCWGGAKRIP